MNGEIELGKEFRPLGLSLCKQLGHGKVLQIVVVSDYVNWSSAAFEVLLPMLEGFKNCKKFLVVGVII